MSTGLLESDFITTNLSLLRTRSESQKQPNEMVSSNISGINWAQWETEDLEAKLSERLENNKKLGAKAKRDFEVESSFFNEFYVNVWGKDIAKQLVSLGELLRKAIKILGYKRSTNPILSFLCNDYVKTNLIKTGLINANTFKAIYNSVAEELIPDTEFAKDNDYNLVYCQALYKKPPREILDYFKLQKEILKNVDKDPQKYQALNKKLFIKVQNIDGRSSQQIKKYARDLHEMSAEKIPSIKDAEINMLLLAKELKNVFMGKSADLKTATHLTRTSLDNLMAELDTPARLLAALTMIVATTGSEQAKKIMEDSGFSGVSAKNLAAAAKSVAAVLSNKLNKDSVKVLVQAIGDKVDELFHR